MAGVEPVKGAFSIRSATPAQYVIDVVEIGDDQIRITESKDVFERAALAQQNPERGASRMSTRLARHSE